MVIITVNQYEIFVLITLNQPMFINHHGLFINHHVYKLFEIVNHKKWKNLDNMIKEWSWYEEWRSILCICNHPCMSYYLYFNLITPKYKHLCSMTYPSPINWSSLTRKGKLLVLLMVHLDQNSMEATRGPGFVWASISLWLFLLSLI